MLEREFVYSEDFPLRVGFIVSETTGLDTSGQQRALFECSFCSTIVFLHLYTSEPNAFFKTRWPRDFSVPTDVWVEHHTCCDWLEFYLRCGVRVCRRSWLKTETLCCGWQASARMMTMTQTELRKAWITSAFTWPGRKTKPFRCWATRKPTRLPAAARRRASETCWTYDREFHDFTRQKIISFVATIFFLFCYLMESASVACCV